MTAAIPADRGTAVAGDAWLPLVVSALDGMPLADGTVTWLEGVLARAPVDLPVALETRLMGGALRFDVGLRIATPGQARRAVELMDLAESRGILLDWAAGRHPEIPFLWLELDAERGASPLRPLVIPRLHPTCELGALLDRLVPALCGGELDGVKRAMLVECLERLPAPAYLDYLFDLRSRGSRNLRVDFADLAPDRIGPYLESLGRSDLAAAVAPAAELLEQGERFQVSFELGDDGIQPRLGVEASFAGWPGRDPRWEGLLERLVAAGLCTPSHRGLLTAWSGYSRCGEEGWPTGVPSGFLVRRPSHLKLVCHPERELQAKGYLLYGWYVRTAEGAVTMGDLDLHDHAAAGART